jgi:cytochrome P450
MADGRSPSTPARGPGALPPGPPASQSFFEEVSRFRDLQADVLGMVAQRFAVYGDFYYVRGRIPNYGTCDPDVMHEVLVTQARSFVKRSANLEVLGGGLLTSDGDFWRRQRRLVQPGFQKDSIHRYGAIMTEEIEALLARWARCRELELRREMLDLTLRIVCRALFGQQYRGDSRKLGRAVSTLQEGVLTGMLLPRWLPTFGNLRSRYLENHLDREVFAIIDSDQTGRDSLLGELKAAADEHGTMTRKQLRDEVVTLFLAGHETTALLLTWALYLAALHPEVDAALAEEANAAAGRDPITAAHRPALAYTERVLKETLRLYPPVYVIPRIAAERVTLSGYVVEPGAEVWLWPYFTHHDARYFSRPERFDPDRFLAGGEAERNPRAYFPFGAGSRACVGRHFALLEAVLALSAIVRRFRVELLDFRPLRPHPRITLAPSRPLRARLVPR